MAGLRNTGWIEDCGRRWGWRNWFALNRVGLYWATEEVFSALSSFKEAGIWRSLSHEITVWVGVVTNVFIIPLLRLKGAIALPINKARATTVVTATFLSRKYTVPSRMRKMPNLVSEW